MKGSQAFRYMKAARAGTGVQRASERRERQLAKAWPAWSGLRDTVPQPQPPSPTGAKHHLPWGFCGRHTVPRGAGDAASHPFLPLRGLGRGRGRVCLSQSWAHSLTGSPTRTSVVGARKGGPQTCLQADMPDLGQQEIHWGLSRGAVGTEKAGSVGRGVQRGGQWSRGEHESS